MSAVPLTPELRAYAPDFARRFALIVAGLVATIARAFLRDPRLVPLIIPLCARLTRAVRRCGGLMAMLAAGRLPRHRRPGRSGPHASIARIPALRIPAGSAWLVQTLRHEAAAYASQLAHLLAEPEAAELLAAVPATDRFLRPLCRMLGLPRRAAKRSGADSDRGALAPRERSRPVDQEAAAPPPPTLPPPPCPHVGFPWFPLPAARRA